MTTEQLQKAIRAQPFRPFELCKADGATVFVRHPEMIAHNPGSRTAVVALEGDDIELVDLLLVTSLRTRDPAKAS